MMAQKHWLDEIYADTKIFKEIGPTSNHKGAHQCVSPEDAFVSIGTFTCESFHRIVYSMNHCLL